MRLKFAVIQLGKNDRFGYLYEEVTEMIEERGIKILRNDIGGDIKLELTGKI